MRDDGLASDGQSAAESEGWRSRLWRAERSGSEAWRSSFRWVLRCRVLVHAGGLVFDVFLHPRVNTSPALFVAVSAQGFPSFCGRRSMRQPRADRCCLPSGNRHESLNLSLAFSLSLWSPVLPSCCTVVTKYWEYSECFFWGAILCYTQIGDKSNPKKKKKKKTKKKKIKQTKIKKKLVTI